MSQRDYKPPKTGGKKPGNKRNAKETGNGKSGGASLPQQASSQPRVDPPTDYGSDQTVRQTSQMEPQMSLPDLKVTIKGKVYQGEGKAVKDALITAYAVENIEIRAQVYADLMLQNKDLATAVWAGFSAFTTAFVTGDPLPLQSEPDRTKLIDMSKTPEVVKQGDQGTLPNITNTLVPLNQAPHKSNEEEMSKKLTAEEQLKVYDNITNPAPSGGVLSNLKEVDWSTVGKLPEEKVAGTDLGGPLETEKIVLQQLYFDGEEVPVFPVTQEEMDLVEKLIIEDTPPFRITFEGHGKRVNRTAIWTSSTTGMTYTPIGAGIWSEAMAIRVRQYGTPSLPVDAGELVIPEGLQLFSKAYLTTTFKSERPMKQIHIQEMPNFFYAQVINISQYYNSVKIPKSTQVSIDGLGGKYPLIPKEDNPLYAGVASTGFSAAAIKVRKEEDHPLHKQYRAMGGADDQIYRGQKFGEGRYEYLDPISYVLRMTRTENEDEYFISEDIFRKYVLKFTPVTMSFPDWKQEAQWSDFARIRIVSKDLGRYWRYMLNSIPGLAKRMFYTQVSRTLSNIQLGYNKSTAIEQNLTKRISRRLTTTTPIMDALARMLAGSPGQHIAQLCQNFHFGGQVKYRPLWKKLTSIQDLDYIVALLISCWLIPESMKGRGWRYACFNMIMSALHHDPRVEDSWSSVYGTPDGRVLKTGNYGTRAKRGMVSSQINASPNYINQMNYLLKPAGWDGIDSSNSVSTFVQTLKKLCCSIYNFEYARRHYGMTHEEYVSSRTVHDDDTGVLYLPRYEEGEACHVSPWCGVGGELTYMAEKTPSFEEDAMLSITRWIQYEVCQKFPSEIPNMWSDSDQGRNYLAAWMHAVEPLFCRLGIAMAHLNSVIKTDAMWFGTQEGYYDPNITDSDAHEPRWMKSRDLGMYGEEETTIPYDPTKLMAFPFTVDPPATLPKCETDRPSHFKWSLQLPTMCKIFADVHHTLITINSTFERDEFGKPVEAEIPTIDYTRFGVKGVSFATSDMYLLYQASAKRFEGKLSKAQQEIFTMAMEAHRSIKPRSLDGKGSVDPFGDGTITELPLLSRAFEEKFHEARSKAIPFDYHMVEGVYAFACETVATLPDIELPKPRIVGEPFILDTDSSMGLRVLVPVEIPGRITKSGKPQRQRWLLASASKDVIQFMPLMKGSQATWGFPNEEKPPWDGIWFDQKSCSKLMDTHYQTLIVDFVQRWNGMLFFEGTYFWINFKKVLPEETPRETFHFSLDTNHVPLFSFQYREMTEMHLINIAPARIFWHPCHLGLEWITKNTDPKLGQNLEPFLPCARDAETGEIKPPNPKLSNYTNRFVHYVHDKTLNIEKTPEIEMLHSEQKMKNIWLDPEAYLMQTGIESKLSK